MKKVTHDRTRRRDVPACIKARGRSRRQRRRNGRSSGQGRKMGKDFRIYFPSSRAAGNTLGFKVFVAARLDPAIG